MKRSDVPSEQEAEHFEWEISMHRHLSLRRGVVDISTAIICLIFLLIWALLAVNGVPLPLPIGT